MRQLLILISLCLATRVAAHELRPAYLELTEAPDGTVSAMWKTPMRGDLRLALDVEISGVADNVSPVVSRETGDAAVQTWRLRMRESLRGQSLRIIGLEATMTDALVRVLFHDGTTWVQRLTPQQPAATIPFHQSGFNVAAVYLRLGVEHILLGIDHLLFVLALLLICRSSTALMKTITAFTVAHSITLALATLGFVHVPSKPVEAVIALSIVFVAAEIVHDRRGRPGVTARAPWVVSFTFGLLHGFGFAGALSEVGLPAGHIPAALLFFNVGVELGQLAFVAAALALSHLARRIRWSLPGWAELLPAYAIGSVAMFWVVQRIAAFP